MYEQEAAVEIIAGTATITIECLASGDDGNLLPAATVTAASPIAGMDSTATIATTVTEGEDEEAIEDLRTRVVARMQNQPQGGAAADYVGWAREVPGHRQGVRLQHGPRVRHGVSAGGRDRGKPHPRRGEDHRSRELRGVEQPPHPLRNRARRRDDRAGRGRDHHGHAARRRRTRAAVEADIEAYLYAAYPAQYVDEVNPTNVVSAAAIWAIIAAHGAVATAVTLSLGVNYTLDDDEIVALGAMTWV